MAEQENNTKVCTKCGEEKDLSQFLYYRETRNGKWKYRAQCRECERAKQREGARKRSPERRQEERRKIAEKKGKSYAPFAIKYKCGQTPILWERNAKQAWEYWLKYRAPDLWIIAYWQSMGKPWANPRLTKAEQWNIRYNRDPIFQIKQRLRRQFRKAARRDGIADLMREAINRGGRSEKVERDLGYSISELKNHLERQFTKGMDWNRFMKGEIHIDHIIPQASFDLSDDAEYKACWALTNLRPMWAKANIAKSNKILFLL